MHGRGGTRARTVIAVATASLLHTSCVVHQGDGWARPHAAADAEPEAAGAVSLIVIGAPAPGLTAKQVAAHLRDVLDAERESHDAVAVVWAGDNVFPAGLGLSEAGDDCLTIDAAWSRRGTTELAQTIPSPGPDAQWSGSWAALGRRDWRCGDPSAQLGVPAPDGQPYTVAAHHYVTRIWSDGRAQVVSACGAGRCIVDPMDEADMPAVDLVFVDQSGWIFPPDDEDGAAYARAVNEDLDGLISALEAEREYAERDGTALPPRILVSNVAIESAGAHGQGGLNPSATAHRQHPAVLRAVQTGLVRGVVAGLDRSLQLIDDLDPAMQRVAKVWIEYPVFQVVSGAAGRPDARAPGSRRQYPWNQGIGIVPEFHSTLPGLAVIRVGAETTDLELHALRAGRWEVARRSVPTRVDPLPKARHAPPMTPCPRCDPEQSPANR